MKRSAVRSYRTVVLVLALLLLISLVFTTIFGKKYSDAKRQLSAVEADMNELGNALAAALIDGSEKQESYDAVQASYEALQLSYEALQAEYAELEANYAAQGAKDTEAYNQLDSKYKALSSDYQALQSRYKALEEQYQKYTGNVKIAYLTFDDGVSVNTEKILNILDEYNVHATFFANWKSWGEKWYAEIVNRGHALGNHCASHEWADVYKSPEAFREQVTLFQENVKRVTGGYVPQLFRFPGGSNNTVHKNYNANVIPEAIQILNSMGLTYFDWNVDSGDADGNHIPANTLINNVLKGTNNRKSIIVLMHDTGPTKDTTVEALPAIIQGLKDQGYVFASLTPASDLVQFRKS